jgi:hypothetical protein
MKTALWYSFRPVSFPAILTRLGDVLMVELNNKKLEHAEFEIHRNTPFEFISTAEPLPSLSVTVVTVNQPKGSWVTVAAKKNPVIGMQK